MENNKIESLLVQILENQTQIQTDIKDIKTDLKELNTKVDSNHEDVVKRLDKIEFLTQDLDPKNATRHTEIFVKIETLSKDIKFIKHKLHETEEEIFDIRDHLKIVK